jgi:hypothetical protein
MSWATPQDIKDRWVGTDVPTDDDLLTALISDAEAVVLAEYPLIQDRIDDNLLDEAVVVMVVARMVSRLLRNPEALSYHQTAVGPFSQARNFGENSDIWMSEQEKNMLAPKTRGKAFEVDLGWVSAEAAEPEAAL